MIKFTVKDKKPHVIIKDLLIITNEECTVEKPFIHYTNEYGEVGSAEIKYNTFVVQPKPMFFIKQAYKLFIFHFKKDVNKYKAYAISKLSQLLDYLRLRNL